MSTEWSPPRSSRAVPVDPEVDDQTIARGLAIARKVAVALLLCGLLYSASLAQLVLFAYWQTLPIVFGEVMFALMTGLYFFLGSRIYDGDSVATLAGAVTGFASTLFSTSWFLYLLLNGVFSPLSVFVPAASVLCGVGCLLLIPKTTAISAARKRLLEEP